MEHKDQGSIYPHAGGYGENRKTVAINEKHCWKTEE